MCPLKAEIAQLVERFTRNEEVPGSSPGFGSKGRDDCHAIKCKKPYVSVICKAFSFFVLGRKEQRQHVYLKEIDVLAKILGRTNTNMTRHYAKFSEKLIGKEMMKIGQVFAEAN